MPNLLTRVMSERRDLVHDYLREQGERMTKLDDVLEHSTWWLAVAEPEQIRIYPNGSYEIETFPDGKTSHISVNPDYIIKAGVSKRTGNLKNVIFEKASTPAAREEISRSDLERGIYALHPKRELVRNLVEKLFDERGELHRAYREFPRMPLD